MTLPGGAALFDSSASRAYVLIDDGLVARFGAALAWASRLDSVRLDVLVDGPPPAAGIIARRASAFSSPKTGVWAVAGRDLSPALPTEPVLDATSPDPALVSLLRDHGLEVVWEHGVLRGEVLGLEIARTVGSRLEVGVGRHDRMARVEMRPGEDLGEALDEASAVVRSLRRPDAPPHPANALARSRWMRSILVRSPASLGLPPVGDLTAVAPPLPWVDLPEAPAAPAVGRLPSGRPVVVVCSVGVDMDLVPSAADCRLLYGGDGADLWLVVPEGDDLPVTRDLAARLWRPAEVQVAPRDWKRS